MSYKDKKAELYQQLALWLEKPAEFPAQDDYGIASGESVWVFKWENMSEAFLDNFYDTGFEACTRSHFADIFDIVDNSDVPDGVVGHFFTRKLKSNWLPFAITHVDLNDAKQWSEGGYKDEGIQYSYMLLVNLDEYEEGDARIYYLEMNGTFTPALKIKRDEDLSINSLNLNAPKLGC